VERLTARIQKRIEEAIREHPEQWLWFHKRFKHIRRD
jgi:KDO2-lipid IV(A) lauroyltransferase